MTTVVIGGGLMGLATAQALLDRNKQVIVLEANESVGVECSFANGGLLTPSLPEPWNSPGVFKHLVASLFSTQAPLKLRPSVIPSLLGWGIGFIRHSSRSRFEHSVLENYRLACYSLEMTQELTDRFSLQYDFSDQGTLCIYDSADSMRERSDLCRLLEPHGLAAQQLAAEEVIAMEPALKPALGQIAGGIWLPDDARGDAYKFCVALHDAILQQGGEIRTGVTVDKISVNGNTVDAVYVGAERIPANRLVVATGSLSPRLLQPLGIHLPIQPAKGYSLTLHVAETALLPEVAIGDDAHHAVLTPLGDRLRVAGTAEFTGFNNALTPSRLVALQNVIADVFPEIAASVDPEEMLPWTGLRPMSNDGRPFVGPTSVDGLYVNAGHGALGWTMAAGSAQLVADLLTGLQPALETEAFRPMR